MKELEGIYPIEKMAKFLKVSRQGYHKYKNRKKTLKYYEDMALKIEIERIFDESYGTYGARRISFELKENGYNYGKHRVGRLLDELDLKARASKKFKVTTDSEHDKPISPDLIKRDFMYN